MLHNEGYTHTHTLSTYVIYTALALQQWLRESASVLRHTYIACLLYSGFEYNSVQISPHSDAGRLWRSSKPLQ